MCVNMELIGTHERAIEWAYPPTAHVFFDPKIGVRKVRLSNCSQAVGD